MVRFSYNFKAALKMASKREEAATVVGDWNMTGVASWRLDFGGNEQITVWRGRSAYRGKYDDEDCEDWVGVHRLMDSPRRCRRPPPMET